MRRTEENHSAAGSTGKSEKRFHDSEPLGHIPKKPRTQDTAPLHSRAHRQFPKVLDGQEMYALLEGDAKGLLDKIRTLEPIGERLQKLMSMVYVIVSKNPRPVHTNQTVLQAWRYFSDSLRRYDWDRDQKGSQAILCQFDNFIYKFTFLSVVLDAKQINIFLTTLLLQDKNPDAKLQRNTLFNLSRFKQGQIVGEIEAKLLNDILDKISKDPGCITFQEIINILMNIKSLTEIAAIHGKIDINSVLATLSKEHANFIQYQQIILIIKELIQARVLSKINIAYIDQLFKNIPEQESTNLDDIVTLLLDMEILTASTVISWKINAAYVNKLLQAILSWPIVPMILDDTDLRQPITPAASVEKYIGALFKVARLSELGLNGKIGAYYINGLLRHLSIQPLDIETIIKILRYMTRIIPTDSWQGEIEIDHLEFLVTRLLAQPATATQLIKVLSLMSSIFHPNIGLQISAVYIQEKFIKRLLSQFPLTTEDCVKTLEELGQSAKRNTLNGQVDIAPLFKAVSADAKASAQQQEQAIFGLMKLAEAKNLSSKINAADINDAIKNIVNDEKSTFVDGEQTLQHLHRLILADSVQGEIDVVWLDRLFEKVSKQATTALDGAHVLWDIMSLAEALHIENKISALGINALLETISKDERVTMEQCLHALQNVARTAKSALKEGEKINASSVNRLLRQIRKAPAATTEQRCRTFRAIKELAGLGCLNGRLRGEHVGKLLKKTLKDGDPDAVQSQFLIINIRDIVQAGSLQDKIAGSGINRLVKKLLEQVQTSMQSRQILCDIAQLAKWDSLEGVKAIYINRILKRISEDQAASTELYRKTIADVSLLLLRSHSSVDGKISGEPINRMLQRIAQDRTASTQSVVTQLHNVGILILRAKVPPRFIQKISAGVDHLYAKFQRAQDVTLPQIHAVAQYLSIRGEPLPRRMMDALHKTRPQPNSTQQRICERLTDAKAEVLVKAWFVDIYIENAKGRFIIELDGASHLEPDGNPKIEDCIRDEVICRDPSVSMLRILNYFQVEEHIHLLIQEFMRGDKRYVIFKPSERQSAGPGWRGDSGFLAAGIQQLRAPGPLSSSLFRSGKEDDSDVDRRSASGERSPSIAYD